MRGSVVRRGKSYYVKIELDPDPITGKRRQKWHSGFRTRRDAERARIDLLSKFDRGEYVEPTHQNLGEFLIEWLRTVEPTLRPGTFDSYSRNVHNHVISHIGSMRLTKVDAGALNGLYATLLASGRRPSSRRGKGYSPEVLARALELRAGGTSLKDTAAALREEFEEASHISKDTVASLLRRHAEAMAGKGKPAGLDPRTVNYVHTILHRAFRDAVRWGRLARNPADAADPPRASPSPTPSRPGTPTPSSRSWRRPRRLTTGSTRCGWCSPPPGCAEARPSDSGGVTSTSMPDAPTSSRRSSLSGARSRSANRRPCEDAARSPSTRRRSPC